MKRCILTMLIAITCTITTHAQIKTDSIMRDTSLVKKKFSLTDERLKKTKINFKGLFQSQYLISTTHNVDVDGLHHSTGDYVSNSFSIKRMRLQSTFDVTQRTTVNVLVNFADFKSNPANKVLENAYIRYKISPALYIIGGQFRPAFGLENTYPVDVVKSLDYSNQYYLFGQNGWESFQEGAGITGDLNGKIPITYAITVTNGNGRNQLNDNDNGKLVASRTTFTLNRKNNLNVSINLGTGHVAATSIYALGLDATGSVAINKKSVLELETEIKQGTNYYLYNTTAAANRLGDMKGYLMRGFYILPNYKYFTSDSTLSALEVSCRYEYLDPNFHLNSNVQSTLTPMLSLAFFQDYNARIQIGYQVNLYQHQTIDTKFKNSNILFLQFQIRF